MCHPSVSDRNKHESFINFEWHSNSFQIANNSITIIDYIVTKFANTKDDTCLASKTMFFVSKKGRLFLSNIIYTIISNRAKKHKLIYLYNVDVYLFFYLFY